ncbi:MAG: glycosyltransferase family 39 protein [Bacteroidota bacterium]
MSTAQKYPTTFYIGLIIWGLINLVQAYWTELDPDEAYYWMYSKQLDWGYFDHPPALAVVIKAGYALFANELGARLGFIVLQLASFVLLYDLAGRPKDKWDNLLLLAILAAMPLLQIYGFVATPDGPLLFFAVLFLWLYQRFLQTNSWGIATLLGITMAAMLYSKYHGVVLIFLVLLSNLKLIKNIKFYYASIFGAMLFFPHLWWQYTNDFPSFRYHLSGRDDTYEIKYTTTYILNQLLIFSPLLFPMIVLALRRTKVNTSLLRTFYFIIFGFWGFFFYTSFKGHVEPQWTILLSIPFTLLLFWEAQQRPAFRKWLWRLSLTTIALLLVARVFMAINPLGLKSNFHSSFWIGVLEEEAGGLPIVFQNSYRNASKYTFYTGEQAYTVTDHAYRKNQFDLWAWEQAIEGDSVYLARVQDPFCSFCPLLETPRQKFRPQIIDRFPVYSRVVIDYSLPATLFKAGAKLTLPLQLYNPYEHPISFFEGNAPLELHSLLYQEAEPALDLRLALENPAMILPPKGQVEVTMQLSLPEDLPKGTYQLAFGIALREMPPAFNSRIEDIQIID